MKKLITISVIFVVIAACDISERVEADYRNVIPLPHEIVMVDGNSFVVEKDTRILYPEDNVLLERNAQFLAGYIEETTGRRLKVEPGQGGNDENVIMLGLDASIDNPEGYELTVLPDRVTIKRAGCQWGFLWFADVAQVCSCYSLWFRYHFACSCH